MRIAGLVLILGFLSLGCLREEQAPASFTPFLNQNTETADSLLQRMSLEEKIGQLILLRSKATDSISRKRITGWAADSRIGGLLVSELPVVEFADLIDSAQMKSSIPLMIGTTERILTNNQFSEAGSVPGERTINALADDTLRSYLLHQYFTQTRQLGINFWLDETASFGFNKQQRLSGKANWLSELKDRHILSLSSHLASSSAGTPGTSFLPSELILENKRAVEAGLSGIGIDSSFVINKLPQPLPVNFWEAYLHQKFKFEGLNLASVSGKESIQLTLAAGADLFLVEEKADSVFNRLLDLYADGLLNEQRLDASVRKILLAKLWMREDLPFRNEYRLPNRMKTLRASVANWEDPLESPVRSSRGRLQAHFQGRGWELLSRRIYAEAITVAGNPHQLLPLHHSGPGFYLLEYSAQPFEEFRAYFKKYADFKAFTARPDSIGRLPSPVSFGDRKETALVLLDEYLLHGRRDSQLIHDIRRLGKEGRLILVNFREPSNLTYFDSTLTVIQLYERNALNEQLVAQVLFGAIPAEGKLPVRVNNSFPKGKGVYLPQVRLQYAPPEAVGIAPEKLVGIDAIARTAIDNRATPGCQVLVAKSGKIIYSKNFGFHSYEQEREVKSTDLYDLASITKVAATTMAAMKFYDEEAFALDDKLKDHLNCDRKSTIKNIPLRKLFIHQSGLQPHMPVIPYLLDRDRPNAECDRYFCKEGQGKYTVKIADQFYFDQEQIDIIQQKIHQLRVGSQRRYRYSDVNFVVIQKMLEEKSGMALDQLVDLYFYQPLGLRHLTFKPSDGFELDQIVPTHNDRRWRQQLVHGYVHDETAALLGGVGGNAGLFGNAEDLAALFQMLLNQGKYGGKQYLRPETIELFTSARHGNHRGLGFDKPSRTNYSARAGSASPESFGHTGFTGTAVWVDPDEELIFVFLSNRIHPSSRNGLLFKKTVRRRIHQVVYDALNTYSDEIPMLESAG